MPDNEAKNSVFTTVPTTVNIMETRVRDLLCCALEGGSNYWYCIANYKFKEGKGFGDYEFAHLDVPFDGGSLLIQADDQYRVLDEAAMIKGLNLMAKNYPKHFEDFMNEDYDANTGDVFLQLSLFGEIVYG